MEEAVSGWKLYGIWWVFQFIRQMHNRIQQEIERRVKAEADLLEWQNRTLSLANLRSLHHQPMPPGVPMSRAPIGPTMKNNAIRQQQIDRDNIVKPTDADILDAANKAVKQNGSK